MKDSTFGFVGMVCGAIGVVAFCCWVVYAVNSSLVSLRVEEVEPGVHCARLTSADGVAIDCWEVEEGI